MCILGAGGNKNVSVQERNSLGDIRKKGIYMVVPVKPGSFIRSPDRFGLFYYLCTRYSIRVFSQDPGNIYSPPVLYIFASRPGQYKSDLCISQALIGKRY
jgi:hypothetical protein